MSIVVPVVTVDSITDHPTAEHLSIVQLAGKQVVTMKDGDGKFRFRAGEIVVFVPESVIVPDVHLQLFGFWDDEKNIGLLAGKKGNRVKSSKFRGELSEGLIWKVEEVSVDDVGTLQVTLLGVDVVVHVGADVAAFYNITDYVPG